MSFPPLSKRTGPACRSEYTFEADYEKSLADAIAIYM